MTRPGDRLRAMAARWCSERTMERLIDPVVADLQAEYGHAVRQGRVWRSRRVRIGGYVACAKAIAVYGGERLMRTTYDSTADDRRALGRTIGWSVMAMVAVTLLMVVPFLPRIPTLLSRLHEIGGLPGKEIGNALLVSLISQALPIAVPVGLTVGIFCGLGGREVSRRLTPAILAVAVLCSLASFALLAWIVPAATQAYRVAIFGSSHHPIDWMNELTLGGLRGQIDLSMHGQMLPVGVNPGVLAFSYYLRWSLSCASFALALFALSVVTRRRFGRWRLGGSACGAFLCYYLLLWGARDLGIHGTVPAFAAAWFPNVVFVLVSIAMMTIGSRRSHAPVRV